MSGLLRFCAVVMLIGAAIGAVVLFAIHQLFLLLLIPEIGLALTFWAVGDLHEKLIPKIEDEHPELEYRAPSAHRRPGKRYREPGRPPELGNPEDL